MKIIKFHPEDYISYGLYSDNALKILRALLSVRERSISIMDAWWRDGYRITKRKTIAKRMDEICAT